MNVKLADVIQFSQDKKILLRCWMLFVFAMIVMVGTTIPFHAAYALPGVDILKSLTDFIVGHLASAIITAISMIFILINVILSVFEVVAGIVMSAAIHWIQVVPYTPINQAFIANSTNPITTGWTIMRDLADMGLIFVLIAIALATILNVSFGKDVGKTIISFIGVAILINFSPLITGVIIDITNILTNIFFQNAGDAWRVFAGNATLGTGSAGDLLGQVANAFRQSDITIPLSLLISSIVSIALTLTVIAAFVTMTFLVLARVLALWILVILSPLAFLMYILPSTKPHFEKWWHNFLQWAMLPIPLGLSYYLSATMVQGLSGSGASGGVLCQGFSGDIAGSASFVGGSFAQLIQKVPYFSNFCVPMVLVMAVAFMFVGFFISFSFSAIGSKMIVAQGTNWGTKLGTASAHGAMRLTGYGYNKAESLAAAGARRAPAPLKKFGAGIAAKNIGVGPFKTTVGAAARAGYQQTKASGRMAAGYALPLTKKGLEQMGKAGGAIGATGTAMAKGVYEAGVTAIINASPIWGPAPLNVNVADASRGIVLTWKWDLGDGATVSTRSPGMHTYAKQGNYTITLTVTGAKGISSTTSTTVRVTGGGTPTGGGPSPFGAALPMPPAAAPLPGGGAGTPFPAPPSGATPLTSTTTPPTLGPIVSEGPATPPTGGAGPTSSTGTAPGAGTASYSSTWTDQQVIYWLQQIARMQQGMGTTMDAWLKEDKDKREKLYEELAKDKDNFNYLAKRIPDIIDSASLQTLQGIYGKNIASSGDAKHAMMETMRTHPEEFKGKDMIPEDFVKKEAANLLQHINGLAVQNIMKNYSKTAQQEFSDSINKIMADDTSYDSFVASNTDLALDLSGGTMHALFPQSRDRSQLIAAMRRNTAKRTP